MIVIADFLIQAWPVGIARPHFPGFRINISASNQQLGESTARAGSLLVWHYLNLNRYPCPDPFLSRITCTSTNACLAHAVPKDGTERRNANH